MVAENKVHVGLRVQGGDCEAEMHTGLGFSGVKFTAEYRAHGGNIIENEEDRARVRGQGAKVIKGRSETWCRR